LGMLCFVQIGILRDSTRRAKVSEGEKGQT